MLALPLQVGSAQPGRSLSLRISKTPHACRAGVLHPPPDAECPLGSCSSHSGHGRVSLMSIHNFRDKAGLLRGRTAFYWPYWPWAPSCLLQGLASILCYLHTVLKGGSSWRSVKPVFFYINTIKGRLESGNGATSSLLPPAAVGLLYSLWFSLDVLLNPQTSLWLTDPSDLLFREGEFALP